MARVLVWRVDSGFRDAARPYRVLVDGKEVGRLKRGAAIELELSPGAHVLQAGIAWKRSARFDISGDGEETFRFRCGPRRGAPALLDLVNPRDDTWLFLEPDIVQVGWGLQVHS